MTDTAQFSDADLQRAIVRGLKITGALFFLFLPVIGWKLGWPSAGLFLVGTVISASGIHEWLRLMSAVMVRMDAGGEARPLAGVLIGFFLRLAISVVVLYASLKFLHGSVYALAGGLLLGIFGLMVEGLRLVKAWTL